MPAIVAQIVTNSGKGVWMWFRIKRTVVSYSDILHTRIPPAFHLTHRRHVGNRLPNIYETRQDYPGGWPSLRPRSGLISTSWPRAVGFCMTRRVHPGVRSRLRFGAPLRLFHTAEGGGPDHFRTAPDETEPYESPSQRPETENWDAPLIVTTSVCFFESPLSSVSESAARHGDFAHEFIRCYYK